MGASGRIFKLCIRLRKAKSLVVSNSFLPVSDDESLEKTVLDIPNSEQNM